MGLNMQSTTILSDNQAAKKQAVNPVTSKRSKHIRLREHFIREAVAEGTVKIEYVPTENMNADILTKGLTGSKFINFRRNLGCVECSTQDIEE